MANQVKIKLVLDVRDGMDAPRLLRVITDDLESKLQRLGVVTAYHLHDSENNIVDKVLQGDGTWLTSR